MLLPPTPTPDLMPQKGRRTASKGVCTHDPESQLKPLLPGKLSPIIRPFPKPPTNPSNQEKTTSDTGVGLLGNQVPSVTEEGDI